MQRIILLIILNILVSYTVSAKKITDPPSNIDITANWQSTGEALAHIQTREPALKEGQLKVFSQELRLARGNYILRFEYEPTFDKTPGAALNNSLGDFTGLKINGVIKPLAFKVGDGKEQVYNAEGHFTVDEPSALVKLQLSIHNTRVIRTWLQGAVFSQNNKSFHAIEPKSGKEYLLVRHIPFLVSKTDNLYYGFGFEGESPLVDADRGNLVSARGEKKFNLGGIKVRTLHFLGMIHQVDLGSGSWYAKKGDNGYSHFVGDTAGSITIAYQDNTEAKLPLVFGFNMWYGRPWDVLWFHYPGGATDNSARLNFDSVLFSGDARPRELIEKSLYLTDGTRQMGSNSSNSRYVFSLNMENRAIKSIRIKGVDDMYSNPLISAITVETADASAGFANLPDISVEPVITKPVTVQHIVRGSFKAEIEKLKRAIYSFTDELPKLTKPEIPVGYFGPRYNFTGTQEAVYAATYLYRNGPECGAKIADDGTTCSSSLAQSQTMRYTFGTGIWRGYQPLFGNIQNWFSLYQSRSPGELPGAGQAWSRGIGELMRESMAFGYGKFINVYTDWLDSLLFADAYPAHWSRVPGYDKNMSSYKTRKVGDIIERGNRENDGHGICMMGRYMTYHWQGHPRQWNERHWNATKAAVDWIQWQLDTDTIFPRKRIDLLYTESESGSYEFYSSYNCLHGLKLCIRMAEELGKAEEVVAWTKLYQRLQKGILDYAITQSSFGPIWLTNSVHWMDEAQKMAHIQLAADGYTYTPLQDYAAGDAMDKKFLEIDRNTYRYLLKDKNYNCLRMYGYGQGMMTQSALLMDEMKDAENFINVMLDHCYMPRMEGWAAPEGIQLHKSGAYWMPVCGYLGQDSHLADSQKALRLMLGIDDNDPDQLRLVPRYPSGWDTMSIADYPVLTGMERQKISYTYIRGKSSEQFDYELQNPVTKMGLRLGPIPMDKEISSVKFNGKDIIFHKLESGDSRWVWIDGLSGKSGKAEVIY